MMPKHLLKKCNVALLLLGAVFNGFSQQSYRNLKGDEAVRKYFTNNKSRFAVSDADLSEIKVTNDHTDASVGIRHIYTQQQLHGLDVVNAVAALHLKEDGTVAHAVYQFASLSVNAAKNATVSGENALRTAMKEAGIDVPLSLPIKTSPQGIEQKTIYKAANTTWDIPIRKAYLLNKKDSSVLLVWEVQLYLRHLQKYWIMYIDVNTNKVVSKQDMVVKCDFGTPALETDEHPVAPFIANRPTVTIQAAPAQNAGQVYKAGLPTTSPIKLTEDNPQPNTGRTSAVTNRYRVFDKPYEAPNQAGATHSLVATAGDALASPDGWHKENNAVAFQFTKGNNVWAFQDPSPGPLGGIPSVDPTRTAYNNGGVGGTPVLTEPFLFDYSINFNNDPTTYQNAAIVNLFYWNNLMHDVFYHFGFTEAAQNFEDSHNFSTGLNRGNTPLGQNDAVLAQAQDGGGTNNANFLTLADGIGGQMQMYLWTGSTPDSIVLINSSTIHPPANGQKYFSFQGSFGNSTLANNDLYTKPVLNKPFVIVQKNALATIGTSSEGCGTNQMSVGLPPSNDVNGKIVLIDRGSCSFVEKVLGAQLGGAAGVIVINNVPGADPIAMGGADAVTNAIVIPAVMISYEAGKQLKDALVSGATIVGSLKKNVSTPRRDGDLDNGVVSHEYGHGISTRLTAGGPTPTGHLGGAEQGGEGWSDNFALYLSTTSSDLLPATAAHPHGILPNRGIGSYVVYQPHLTGLGIRETPYSIDMNVNPSTFAYAKLPAYSEAHSIGYLWCSMLYEMQQVLIDSLGFNNDVYNSADPTAAHGVPAGAGGNNVAMRLVMEGLKLQPADPTFVQERDAIIKADSLLYNGIHSCDLWRAFAKRGLGYSAVSGTNALGDEVEQFNENPTCNPQTLLAITKTAQSIMTNNEEIDYVITAKNVSPAAIVAINLTVTDTLPTYTSLVNANGGTLTGNIIKWTIASLAKDSSTSFKVKVKVNHPSPATLILNEDNEGATNLFSSTNTGFQKFDLITTGAYSGSKVWFVQDYDIPGSNAILKLTAPIAIPAGGGSLIFNHKYSSEAGYDGGVVEVSTDNSTWVHLNTFSQNGYNSTIPTLNNPLIGLTDLPAFSGGSPGYVQSVASLAAYAGQSVYIRFRFTSDPAGGSVAGGGWWIDDVYIASGASFITNRAAANATNAASKVKAEAGTLIINSPCMSTLTKLIPEGANAYTADGVCVDNFANWMHFYKGTNLLFSIKKTPETANIVAGNVMVGVDTGSQAVHIIAPYTDVYADSPWYVMRRYWKVSSATTLTAPVAVRFYYTAAEFAELQAKATSITNNNNAKVYQFTTAANSVPSQGQSNVQASEVLYPAYNYLGASGNYQYIQYNISQFTGGGGIGGTGTPYVTFVFTGTGNYNVRESWNNKTVPPNPLPNGKEIIIDPASGECLLNVPQTISTGGKIAVKAGKKLNIQGNLIIQ